MAKQQFLENSTDTIRLTVYDNNRPLIPSSATIVLYKPDGGVLQASVAVTAIDATTGEMTYALTATHTATNDLNYKAVWAYVVSGVTYNQTQLFDVVLSELSIPITDEDLYNELESLRQSFFQVTSTATAGATGSLTDTKRREADDYFKGGTLEIVSGTGLGQKRDITGFTQSTGVFTVTPNFGTTPDTTSKYVAVKSYAKKIQSAFDQLQQMIYNKGKRNELILESSQIAVPLIYLTIHLIGIDLMKDQGDKWDRIQELYFKKFETAFNTMKLDYDSDESGLIDETEGQKNTTELRISRA